MLGIPIYSSCSMQSCEDSRLSKCVHTIAGNTYEQGFKFAGLASLKTSAKYIPPPPIVPAIVPDTYNNILLMKVAV